MSLSAGVEGEIFNVGVEAGYELQKCHTSESARTCTWSDGGCHRVATAQEVVVQRGYARRRCSSDKGDYTAWLKDWKHRVPTKLAALSCDNGCQRVGLEGVGLVKAECLHGALGLTVRSLQYAVLVQ